MIKLLRKRLLAASYWTCARCGTTNQGLYCKECNNRRPY